MRAPGALLPRTIRQIVRLGWPAAMLQIAWNAGTIVLYNILGRLGEASITAMAAIANGLRIEATHLPAGLCPQHVGIGSHRPEPGGGKSRPGGTGGLADRRRG